MSFALIAACILTLWVVISVPVALVVGRIPRDAERADARAHLEHELELQATGRR